MEYFLSFESFVVGIQEQNLGFKCLSSAKNGKRKKLRIVFLYTNRIESKLFRMFFFCLDKKISVIQKF